MTGTEDWSHVIYASGTIGNDSLLIDTEGIDKPVLNNEDALDELSLEVALEHGVLGNPGSGAIEALGPYTLLTHTDSQSVYIRVKNMSSEPVEFTLQIEGSEVCESVDMDVSVSASLDMVNYIDVPVSIKNINDAGEYTIKVELLYSGSVVAKTDFSATLLEPTQEMRTPGQNYTLTVGSPTL